MIISVCDNVDKRPKQGVEHDAAVCTGCAPHICCLLHARADSGGGKFWVRVYLTPTEGPIDFCRKMTAHIIARVRAKSGFLVENGNGDIEESVQVRLRIV